MRDVQARQALRLHLARVSPRQRELLVRAAGGLERLASLRESTAIAGGASVEAARALRGVTEAEVDSELAACARKGVTLAHRSDPAFPPLLLQIPDPPWALWLRGTLPDPQLLPLAVVGPRRPTPYGLAVARRLARELADLGALLVSGGARGIDAVAHACALDAGEPTVAVLGCGVDIDYPEAHRALFRRIAATGAVVSEHPCGTPPLPHHFPIRNRLLAGWARAVLVVEATTRSGSLITARLGLEQGRDVLAVPGPITSRWSEGTNELLASGARVLRNAFDVLGELRPEERLRLRTPPATDPPRACGQPADDPVLAALREGEALALDDLMAATRLTAGAVLARLVGLEAAGRVQSLAGGLWLRR